MTSRADIWNVGYIVPGQTFKTQRTYETRDIDAFAELPGDRNPIHMDEDWAIGKGFGGRYDCPEIHSPHRRKKITAEKLWSVLQRAHERIIVTGGSGDIGAAVYRKIAAMGLITIIAYRTGQTKALALAEETGGVPAALDLTNIGSIDNFVSGFKTEKSKPVLGLVLAASPAPELSTIGSCTVEELTVQIKTNITEHFHLVDQLIRQHISSLQEGFVAAILSSALAGAGKSKAMSRMAAYTVAKFGLRGVVEAAAGDYVWLRTYCNYPYFTETAMLDVFDKRFLDVLRAKRKFETPEEVSKRIARFINSDEGTY
jgi:NAD(P)-dependent dehydrogenase (short-subunit alcohol dehydrogenase family)